MKSGEAPVFVKIEDYKDIVDILELIKDKLNEAKATLGSLNELKNEEDSELERWKSALNDIERKVEHIDRTLLEPQEAW